jgi:hypothetical protein
MARKLNVAFAFFVFVSTAVCADEKKFFRLCTEPFGEKICSCLTAEHLRQLSRQESEIIFNVTSAFFEGQDVGALMDSYDQAHGKNSYFKVLEKSQKIQAVCIEKNS